jgi:hypothetical protein
MRHFAIRCLLLSLSFGPLSAQTFWDVPRRDREIHVDGLLDEWEGVPAILLAPSVEGLRSDGPFEGDGDVRADIRAMWDTDYLYLAVSWADDVWDVEEVRRQDAVWIGPEGTRRDRMYFFDYLRFQIREPDYDYTLWVSPRVDGRGPFFWTRLLEGFRGRERATAAPMISAQERDGRVTMEIILMWNQLRRKPERNRPVPLTLILTDSDHPGRFLESKLEFLKWLTWRGAIRFVD